MANRNSNCNSITDITVNQKTQPIIRMFNLNFNKNE